MQTGATAMLKFAKMGNEGVLWSEGFSRTWGAHSGSPVVGNGVGEGVCSTVWGGKVLGGGGSVLGAPVVVGTGTVVCGTKVVAGGVSGANVVAGTGGSVVGGAGGDSAQRQSHWVQAALSRASYPQWRQLPLPQRHCCCLSAAADSGNDSATNSKTACQLGIKRVEVAIRGVQASRRESSSAPGLVPQAVTPMCPTEVRSDSMLAKTIV